MGTSASSSGPTGGVPLVPPWVEDSSTDPSDGEQGSHANGDQETPANSQAPISSPARFKGARLNLGRFAKSGSKASLRRGLAHYVRTGLGGSRQASRRMSGTARKSGALFEVLSALQSGAAPPEDLGVDVGELAGRPAAETANRIALAISPVDGSLDAEASRQSLSLALRELVSREPDADLNALPPSQIELVIEIFIAEDICRRIELDVGKSIFEKASNAAAAVSRLRQMNRFVRQTVAASFRRLKRTSDQLTRRSATQLSHRVIQDTFEVFEDYI